jgi:hypothetical protein
MADDKLRGGLCGAAAQVVDRFRRRMSRRRGAGGWESLLSLLSWVYLGRRGTRSDSPVIGS